MKEKTIALARIVPLPDNAIVTIKYDKLRYYWSALLKELHCIPSSFIHHIVRYDDEVTGNYDDDGRWKCMMIMNGGVHTHTHIHNNTKKQQQQQFFPPVSFHSSVTMFDFIS